MGYVHATIALSNPRRPELDALPVTARADSGALMLCIPAALAASLHVQQESLRQVCVADGRVLQVPYVGPLRVDFEGRCCFVGALVLGDEVLLGAVTDGRHGSDREPGPPASRGGPPQPPHAARPGLRGLTRG